jgi:hypothetical protein
MIRKNTMRRKSPAASDFGISGHPFRTTSTMLSESPPSPQGEEHLSSPSLLTPRSKDHSDENGEDATDNYNSSDCIPHVTCSDESE